MRLILLTILPLAAAACQEAETPKAVAKADDVVVLADVNSPPPSPEPSATDAAEERAVSSETVEAKFTGFVQGDYLYATLAPASGATIAGDPMVRSDEIAAFLAAHRGKALTVGLDTVNMYLEAAGERMDVVILRSARLGDLTAERWWAERTPAQQAAAREAAEDLAASIER